MVKNNLKKGFSLAEALIVMVIISVFFATAAKVITTKPKAKRIVNEHGYYECYIKGGGIYQRYVRQDLPAEEENVSVCSFEAPTGVGFFNINSYSPVAHSSFEPNINNKLRINISGGGINISSSNGSYSLSSNTDSDIQKKFFGAIYPDSELFNNGAIRSGILISW